MLRLEKIPRSRDVRITLSNLKEKKNFYLLFAFTLALTLHLLPFLFFHVDFFSIPKKFTLDPPTFVRTEFPFSESETFAENVQEKIDAHFLPPSLFPRFPSPSFCSDVDLDTSFMIEKDFLRCLEKDLFISALKGQEGIYD